MQSLKRNGPPTTQPPPKCMPGANAVHSNPAWPPPGPRESQPHLRAFHFPWEEGREHQVSSPLPLALLRAAGHARSRSPISKHILMRRCSLFLVFVPARLVFGFFFVFCSWSVLAAVAGLPLSVAVGCLTLEHGPSSRAFSHNTMLTSSCHRSTAAVQWNHWAILWDVFSFWPFFFCCPLQGSPPSAAQAWTFHRGRSLPPTAVQHTHATQKGVVSNAHPSGPHALLEVFVASRLLGKVPLEGAPGSVQALCASLAFDDTGHCVASVLWCWSAMHHAGVMCGFRTIGTCSIRMQDDVISTLTCAQASTQPSLFPGPQVWFFFCFLFVVAVVVLVVEGFSWLFAAVASMAPWLPVTGLPSPPCCCMRIRRHTKRATMSAKGVGPFCRAERGRPGTTVLGSQSATHLTLSAVQDKRPGLAPDFEANPSSEMHKAARAANLHSTWGSQEQKQEGASK